MTHVQARAIYYHLDNSRVVFKNEYLSMIARLLRVLWNIMNGFLCGFGCVGFELTRRGLPLLDWQDLLTRQSLCLTKLSQGNLPISDQCLMISPQLLCDTAVCFLHAHRMGTHVWSPNMKSNPLVCFLLVAYSTLAVLKTIHTLGPLQIFAARMFMALLSGTRVCTKL